METIVNRSVAFFTGRESFLQELHETLKSKRLVAINAPAGMGKTALALEYARRFSHAYDGIFRLNIASAENWLADNLELAERLALPLAEGERNLPGVTAALQNWLAQHPNTLLIVDNVADVTPSLPTEQATCHMLFLTREPVNDPAIAHLSLEKLDRQQGALLLLRQTGQLPADAPLDQAEEELREVAETLADEMDGLPLGLSLAGAYMRVFGVGLREYAARLTQLKGPDKRATGALAVACMLPVISLQRTQPFTSELLWLCVNLAPGAIPRELFVQGASELTPTLQMTAQRHALLDEAFTLLGSLGLLVADETGSGLSMQETVQAALRRSQTQEKRKELVTRALRAFAHLLPTLDQKPLAARVRVAAQIVHLVTLSSGWTIPHEPVADLFAWTASLLWEQGLIQDAEPVLGKTLVIYERTLGPTHPRIVTILLNLATLNCLLKQYSVAETFSQRAILTSARTVDTDYQDMLLSLDNLGRIYEQQDRRQEAKSCYEKAISIGDRVGLQNHRYYLESMYDLAMLSVDQGAYEEAEPLLRKVCTAWQLSPDTQNPSILEAWRNFAEVSVKQKNWPQAEVCYQHLLPICERLLGEEHPETLHSMEQAGRASLAQGKLAQAETYLQRTLNVRERILGPHHPDVAACLNVLATIALERERFDDALVLLGRIQSIYESRAEPEDLALVEVLDNLAVIETAQKHYEQAISALQRSLDIRRRILGKEHLDLVENLSNLAALYLTIERSREAEPLLLNALYIYQNAQKPEDLALDSVLTNLATIAMERAHYWEAKMYLERSRGIRSQALGDRSPETAEILYRLALVAVAEKEWEEAKTLLRRALPMYQEALGSEHPQTAACLELMLTFSIYPTSTTQVENVAEAEEYHQHGQPLYEAGSGLEDSTAQSSLEQMAMLYLQQQKFAQAEEAFQQLFEVKERTLGLEHSDTRVLLQNVAQLALIQGNVVRAEALYQRLYTFCESALEAGHAETRQYLEQLGMLYLQQGKVEEAEKAFQHLAQILS